MKNRYRLKFSKTDRMRFIGHLDLLKLYQKTFRRANIPIAYSAGYNPHQLMSFAAPLPLGFKSIAEYLDIELIDEVNTEILKATINNNLPNGIEILEINKIEQQQSSASALEAASYEVLLPCSKNLSEAVERMINLDELFADKKTKSNFSKVDIRKDIFKLEVVFLNTIEMLISTGSKQNLKPELVVECIFGFMGIEYNKFEPRYLRKEMYARQKDQFVELMVKCE